MTEQLGQVGNASSLHGSGPGARRVVEESRETDGRGPRRAAERGRLHPRRHRERQPGASRACSGPRRSPTTHAVAGAGRARVEHHAVLDPPMWLADHEGAELVAGSRSTATAGSRPERPARALEADPRPGRVRQRHVGQQRGRHGRSRSPSVAAVAAAARRPAAHRCGAGGRSACRSTSPPAASTPLTVTGAQGRRPGTGSARCCSAATWTACRCCTAAGRSETSGPGTLDVPAIAAFAVAVELAVEGAGASARAARRAARGPGDRRARGRSRCAAERRPSCRRAPAAGQRALLVPRLRGRLRC